MEKNSLDTFEQRGSNRVFFIAEVGKNFIQTEEDRSVSEYIENAKALIKKAKESGADAVKFQTHCLEDEQADIQIFAPHFSGADRYNWIKRNEEATPLEFWQEIKKYSDKLGIIFFSTPMSRMAAKKLEKIGVPLWKVGSGDILDFIMLDYIAETGKPVIISTGMSTLGEIDQTVTFLKARTGDISILYCISKYPASPEDINLPVIKLLRDRYNLPVGFSDHTLDDRSVLGAVGMGAGIIEKHFSLNRGLFGSDHKVSLTPDEFSSMVNKIRHGEKTVYDFAPVADKPLLEDEAVFRPFFRKTLVAGQPVTAGMVITKDMVYAMRPQRFLLGFSSEEYGVVIGRQAKRNINKYEPLSPNNVV